jgi:predicted MPP superfamily phosphohydrolase
MARKVTGHTHGGQVYVPFYGAPIIPGRGPRRLAYGHVRERGRDLVVTAGIGTSILPLRLNMPPEITLVTLRAP